MNYWGYSTYYGPSGGYDIFGGIFHILLILLVVFIIIRLVRGGPRSRRWGGPWGGPWDQKTALDILKERYAKGEINKEEFDAKKKDLEEMPK